MILQVILEGIGLGAILMLVCAFGIRKGAVGMVHLYHDDVQRRCIQLGLTTREEIQRNAIRMKICCLPIYLAYVLVCVYAVNGARGFVAGFWHLLVILSLMNLIDRLLIDGYWVGRTQGLDDPRHGGPEALHHASRRKAQVAFRHGGRSGDRGGAFRVDGADPVKLPGLTQIFISSCGGEIPCGLKPLGILKIPLCCSFTPWA